MAKVVVIAEPESLAARLVECLRASAIVEFCEHAESASDADTVVYAPPWRARTLLPDLAAAEAVFEQCAQAGVQKVVVLSSALVYGASPHNPGLIAETRPLARNGQNPISSCWAELEALAQGKLGGRQLIILRAAPVLTPDGVDYFNRLLRRRPALTLPGHDPSLQCLSVDDLAQAVVCAVERGAGGIYNVAPDGVIPLRAALRLVGAPRWPIPRTLQRLARAGLKRLGLAVDSAQLDFIRYSWTVSNQKLKDELGFAPQHSSAEAVQRLRIADGGLRIEETGALPTKSVNPHSALRTPQYDDFGLDEDYLAAFGRTLFHFLERYYWRIEVAGLHHVPRVGRVVLVGVHRCFMPWDGILTIDLLHKGTGRVPRFLMHPGLVKLPFCFNFLNKLGAVIACRENSEYVLERDGMLGVFPEGTDGAFTLYRDAYRLGKFISRDFIKLALRYRAPLLPLVMVGSAESFPILKKLEWRWWKRRTEWPCLPVTPTFPFLPLPLPSKWHMQFLAPLHLTRRYGPEAADDPATVRAISQELRERMETAMAQMVSRRKSIFYGSVFEQEVG